MAYTAHVDTFARDNLPPPDELPEVLFELPELAVSGAAQLRRPSCSTGWSRRGTATGRRSTR